MLVTKERKTIQRLKKRAMFLIIVIFSLLYWLRMKYLDVQFLNDQYEVDQYEIMNLESENRTLQLKLDSIQKSISLNTEKKESKIIINKKQEGSKKDSIKIIEYTPEGGSEMLDDHLSDTLKR